MAAVLRRCQRDRLTGYWGELMQQPSNSADEFPRSGDSGPDGLANAGSDTAGAAHASREDLGQLLTGALPLVDAEQLNRHLSECTQCQETLSGIEPPADTFVTKLKTPPPPDPLTEEPACRAMLDQIESIALPGSTSDNTAANPELPPKFREHLLQQRDYELLEPLGAGGMGLVYKARHTRLERLVAIKLLTPQRMGDQSAIARFEREMNVVGQLEHPHIVRANDAGLIDGVHYLVMELVDGVDLDRLVAERGPWPIAAACEAIRQAALGLQHAFNRGIVHRDIKPSNLMLGRSPDGVWQVKILDLGLALLQRPVMGQDAGLTSDGQLMGTLDYMPPEQGTDTRTVDIRADIYSLGATLFKLLTGRAPFASPDHNTVMKKLVALATIAPPSLQTLRPDVPEDLAALVMSMLAKSPADRPQTPADVAQQLAPFCRHADLATLTDPTAKAHTADGDETVSETLLYDGTDQLPNLSLIPGLPDRVPALRDRQRRDSQPDAANGASRGARRWTLWAAGGGALLLLFAVLVVRLNTRDGTVVIELESPEPITSLEVDGQTLTWKTAADGKTVSVQVHPGPVTAITLTTSTGTQIRADLPPEGLRIAAGQQQSVKARLEPSSKMPKVDEAPGSPTQPQIAPAKGTRELADWILSRGGRIGIAVVGTNDGERVLQSHDSLPAGDFHLQFISLERTAITDDDIRRVADLPFLKSLNFAGTAVTDAGLNQLNWLPRLYRLNLRQTGVTDAGMVKLARFPSITHLELSQTKVGDRGLSVIGGWKQLSHLDLAGTAVTDDAAAALSRIDSLRELNLAGTALSQPVIERLCSQLPECRIESSERTYEPEHLATAPLERRLALMVLKRGGRVGCIGPWNPGYVDTRSRLDLPNAPFQLHLVSLVNVDMPLDELEQVVGAERLRVLLLRDNRLGAEGFKVIGPQPQLSALYFGGPLINDQSLENFAEKYPQLEKLGIGFSHTTDAAFEEIRKLPKLALLEIPGTRMTEAGIRAFHQQRPQCRIQSDFGVFEAQPLADQSRDRNAALWVLQLGGLVGGGNPETGYVKGRHAADLPADPYVLNLVNLAGKDVPILSDDLLPKLNGLSDLSALMLDDRISDTGLAQLDKLPKLRGLFLGGKQITNRSVEWIAEHYPKLETLSLAGTAVTDDAVPQLSLLKDLTGLDVIQTSLSEAGVRKLHVALPRCRIESDHGTFAAEPSN